MSPAGSNDWYMVVADPDVLDLGRRPLGMRRVRLAPDVNSVWWSTSVAWTVPDRKSISPLPAIRPEYATFALVETCA